MTKPTITSLSNPLIKQARALRQRKERAETGLFLVEGIHHVGEALDAGWDIDAILYAPEILTSEFGRELTSRAALQSALQPGGLVSPERNAAGTKPAVQPVSVQVMDSLAEKENPQGILAIVHQRKMRLSDLKKVTSGAAVVSPQDPGNVGTILRTLDAVGADVFFQLEGGVDLYHPTSVRASMGTIFSKPVVQTSFAEFLEWKKNNSVQLIGTSARADADYKNFQPQSPWILLLGSEQKGLSPEHLSACDVRLSLPMRGRASSLNLAVAAGVLLYKFM